MNEPRWQQRLENFGSALESLRQPLAGRALTSFSDLEKRGVIHAFEYTFELSWKMLKDYLEFSGIALKPATPRSVIKQAFATGVIDDGQLWIDMMEDRNQSSHLYGQEMSDRVLEEVITRYLVALSALYDDLRQQVDAS